MEGWVETRGQGRGGRRGGCFPSGVRGGGQWRRINGYGGSGGRRPGYDLI